MHEANPDDAAQQVTRVLAIRHGETAWNVDTRIQGQLDIPLNETGRWQAHRLALAMAEECIDALYSSWPWMRVSTFQAVSPCRMASTRVICWPSA